MLSSLIGLTPGSGIITTAPTITAIVDGGDEDSFIATVEGTGTIQLYYRLRGATTWITGQTRSGDGDITQTGLTGDRWYEVYITDAIAGVESSPSAIHYINIAGTDNTIETAITSIFLADSDITDMITDRIYPNYVPQGKAVPAISYQQISGVRDSDLDEPIELVNSRWQINVWAETMAEVRQLANYCRLAFNGSAGTVNTVKISFVELENEGDIPSIRPGTDKLTRYGKRMDFRVWFDD